MKKNQIQKSVNMKNIYSTMSIAEAISTFISSHSSLAWMKIERHLYQTVNTMLAQKKYGFTLAEVMHEDVKGVADELVSYLVSSLIKDKMSKLERFAALDDEAFTKWAYKNSMLKARNLYHKGIAQLEKFSCIDNMVWLPEESSFDEISTQQETLSRAMKAVKHLPECQREAIEMLIDEDHLDRSNKEMALALGVSEGVMNKRIHDARRNLLKMCA